MKKNIKLILFYLGNLISLISIKGKLFSFGAIVQSSFISGFYSIWFKKCGKEFNTLGKIELIGAQYITIGNNVQIFKRLRLEAHDFHNGVKFSPEIIISNDVSINFDCHIGAINRIIIGNGVLIASKVFITDHFHGEINSENLGISPSKRIVTSKGPVVIEDNVWIGEGVAIMPNVTIGKNSIIGANAVVTKSFPANSVIGGIPAKLIKTIE